MNKVPLNKGWMMLEDISSETLISHNLKLAYLNGGEVKFIGDKVVKEYSTERVYLFRKFKNGNAVLKTQESNEKTKLFKDTLCYFDGEYLTINIKVVQKEDYKKYDLDWIRKDLIEIESLNLSSDTREKTHQIKIKGNNFLIAKSNVIHDLIEARRQHLDKEESLPTAKKIASTGNDRKKPTGVIENNKLLNKLSSEIKPKPKAKKLLREFKIPAKRKNIEEQLHNKFCGWIKKYHQNTIFISTTKEVGGIKAVVNNSRKNSHHKHPDVLILKRANKFAGLFIELKKPELEHLIIKYCHFSEKEKQNILNKVHTSITNRQRVIKQWQCLKDLKKEGFMVSFACSLEESLNIAQVYFDTINAHGEMLQNLNKYLKSCLVKYNLQTEENS